MTYYEGLIDEHAGRQSPGQTEWFAACERVLFAVNPPDGAADGDSPIDLQEASRLADEALDELSVAFGIDRSATSDR